MAVSCKRPERGVGVVRGGRGGQILFPRPICQQSSGVWCLTAFSCDALICYEWVLLLCFWLRALCTAPCPLIGFAQSLSAQKHCPIVTRIFVSLTEMHCTKGLCPACETDLRITQKCTVPKDSVLLVTQIFVSLSGVHCIGRTVSHSCHSCIIPCNALYHKESDPLRLQKYHSVQCTEPQRN